MKTLQNFPMYGRSMEEVIIAWKVADALVIPNGMTSMYVYIDL